MTRKKLERLQDDYDLELDAELADRRRDGATLMELKEFVNREIANAVTRGTAISGDQVYRVIAEDVSQQERANIEQRLHEALEEYGHYNRLERLDEADPDDVLDWLAGEFISHESVRTYLESELDVSPEADEALSKSEVLERFQASEERYANIIEYHLEQLSANNPGFSIGDGVSIMIDVDVVCDASGVTKSLREFVESDGCLSERVDSTGDNAGGGAGDGGGDGG